MSLVDTQFNELVIKELTNRPQGEEKYASYQTNNWCRCKCSCGETVYAPVWAVTHGKIKSCGHLRSQNSRKLMERLHETHPNAGAIYITYKGKTLSIADWARDTGIPRTTILYRYHHGWPLNKIFERSNDEGFNDTGRSQPKRPSQNGAGQPALRGNAGCAV